MTNKQPSPDGIMQLGLAFWGAKALLSAVELGVFTELAKGPLDAESLRQRVGVHPRGARDFFDALVALRMLQRQDDMYSNTPDTDYFLDRAKPTYMGAVLELANVNLYGLWGSLTQGLRTGQPQIPLREDDRDIFALLSRDPERNRRFVQAQTGLSIGTARQIAARFPWDRYRTFADVGTAEGCLPVQVALAHRHIQGLGVDLKHVKPIFDRYVHEQGLSERVRFEAVDIFREPMPHVDVIVMGHMLHAWNLEEKRMLVAKAYEALPKGGALLVYDAMIDDNRSENAFGLLMSLDILLETREGFDYTSAACMGWMRDQGFREVRAEKLVGSDTMVVGIK